MCFKCSLIKKIHSSCFVIAKSEFQGILISVVKQMWSGKGKVAQSCPTPCDPMDYSPWNSPGQNTDVGSLFLLQGIFPTQGSNPGLLHCRQTLYHLSHEGSFEYRGQMQFKPALAGRTVSTCVTNKYQASDTAAPRDKHYFRSGFILSIPVLLGLVSFFFWVFFVFLFFFCNDCFGLPWWLRG